MATPRQTDPQFKLRLTPELKHGIEKSAVANNRSMNAEIVARLEGYDRLKEDLQLAINSLASFQEREKQGDKSAEHIYRVASEAQTISRQLIELLLHKLGATEEEITAITRPKAGKK